MEVFINVQVYWIQDFIHFEKLKMYPIRYNMRVSRKSNKMYAPLLQNKINFFTDFPQLLLSSIYSITKLRQTII